MTQLKAHLRRIRNNRFGHPTVLARSEINFTLKGNTYQQLHLVANLHSVELTLRSRKWPNTPCFGAYYQFKQFGQPHSFHQVQAVLDWIDQAVQQFNQGLIPDGIVLRPVQFGVLI